MKRFLAWLDDLAETTRENTTARWLERIAFVFLVLMVVSAPHSIAATQTAWITGMFVWIVRLFIRPRPRLNFSLLDGALWAFFLWSVVTSIFSYDPATSLDKLKGVAIFLILYFVIYNLRNLRAVYFLGFALIASCMVNVVWTPVQRLIGRGIEIHSVNPDGPLAKASLGEGDTLLEADGRKIKTPDELLQRIEQNEITKVKFYRPDFYLVVDVKRADLLAGANSLEKLGFESWRKSRNWRSSGFYGHYTTYAEVLQLIASLTLGLLVAGFFSGRKKFAEPASSERSKRVTFAMLFIAVVGMSVALLMTVTRASQLAFLISAFVIFAVGASRKWLVAAIAVGLPVALGGLFFLQQSRQVGFFDAKDDSTLYRQTMWRDGLRLWSENPRHIVVGVGMDSIQKNWRQWGLFDGGNLPMGHFHSTPVQLLVERGLPALLLWLMVLGIYARSLWKGIRRKGEEETRRQGERETWRRGESDASGIREISPDLRVSSSYRLSSSALNRGILLGCLGAAIGFFTSGLVHYNLGDQEVAMMFFLLMGLGVKVSEISSEKVRAA